MKDRDPKRIRSNISRMRSHLVAEARSVVPEFGNSSEKESLSRDAEFTPLLTTVAVFPKLTELGSPFYSLHRSNLVILSTKVIYFYYSTFFVPKYFYLLK
ncbi:hypothetical protein L1049_017855 [Liquidambar formosana]|uniref:Uncharacterized protein n=1 Tax=Liquidambar formosana TaxID=63359 RepID=A0AAP0NHG8_LIQFO